MAKPGLKTFLAAVLATLTFILPRSSAQNCTNSTTIIRKEWSALTLTERKAYTDAVVCLQNLPSTLDNSVYPGAQNRYDDFLTTHINYTLTIHISGLFLSWHRNFIYLYEQALRNECGYDGYQPY